MVLARLPTKIFLQGVDDVGSSRSLQNFTVQPSKIFAEITRTS